MVICFFILASVFANHQVEWLMMHVVNNLTGDEIFFVEIIKYMSHIFIILIFISHGFRGIGRKPPPSTGP
jgi:hypothetical protein